MLPFSSKLKVCLILYFASLLYKVIKNTFSSSKDCKIYSSGDYRIQLKLGQVLVTINSSLKSYYKFSINFRRIRKYSQFVLETRCCVNLRTVELDIVSLHFLKPVIFSLHVIK